MLSWCVLRACVLVVCSEYMCLVYCLGFVTLAGEELLAVIELLSRQPLFLDWRDINEILSCHLRHITGVSKVGVVSMYTYVQLFMVLYSFRNRQISMHSVRGGVGLWDVAPCALIIVCALLGLFMSCVTTGCHSVAAD